MIFILFYFEFVLLGLVLNRLVHINLSMNIRIHSSNAMRAGGFSYTDRGDSARCVLCRLEVSSWTCNMDPFTVHSERSPLCAFVRSVKSSSHFQVASLSTVDSVSGKDYNLSCIM